MKKFIAVGMIALLAVTSVFAGLSGSVSTSAGYNLDTKEYGFLGTNLANAKLKLTLGEEHAANEVAEDADIYASVKADFDLSVEAGKNVANAKGAAITPAFNLVISEAKIGGTLAEKDWYIDLLGMGGAPDFAASFLDLNGDGDPDSNVALDFRGTKGLKASYADYTVGFGLNGKVDKGTSMAAYFVTPEYALAEGLTLKADVAYSHDAFGTKKDATKQTWYFNNTLSAPIMLGDNAVLVPADKHNLGTGVAVAYANDVISTSVATDLVFQGLKADELDFGFDVAADFTYDFLTVNAYYGYEKQLDLGVDADLNSFDVPVTVSLSLLDLINDSRSLLAGIGFEGYGLELGLNAFVGLYEDPAWEVGVDAAYTIENIGKIAASVGYNSSELLSASASFENETLIPGAKLAFGWYGASDLLQKDTFKEGFLSWEDLENAPTAADFKLSGLNDFGVIKASVSVEF